MGRIPNHLRITIASNIRECRLKKFPGRGGGKECAEAFGVSPQQWSPWERGMRTPDEKRRAQLAEFFGVSVEYLRSDHSSPNTPPQPESTEPSLPPVEPSMGIKELLENSFKLIWLITAMQKDVLLGRRGYPPVIGIMREIRLYLEKKFQER